MPVIRTSASACRSIGRIGSAGRRQRTARAALRLSERAALDRCRRADRQGRDQPAHDPAPLRRCRRYALCRPACRSRGLCGAAKPELRGLIEAARRAKPKCGAPNPAGNGDAMPKSSELSRGRCRESIAPPAAERRLAARIFEPVRKGQFGKVVRFSQEQQSRVAIHCD
jgi:hypothetical protein